MPPRPEPTRLGPAALLLAGAAITAVLASALLDPMAAATVLNALNLAACAAAAWASVRRARRRPEEAGGWYAIAVAAAAQVIYQAWHVAAVPTTGALADYPGPVEYLQPPMLVAVAAGLLVWISRGRHRWGGLRSGLDGFLFGASLLFVLWAVATHQLGWRESLSRFEQGVIITDLALIAASLGLAVHLTAQLGARPDSPLGFIGAGLVAMAASGIAIAMLAMRNRYIVGHVVDVFVLLAAGSFALAALAPGPVVPGPATPEPRRTPAVSLFPYLPLVASLFTAALLLNRPGAEGDRLLTGLGIAIGVALLLRQQLALRDVERLSHHLTETVAARTLELARAQSALARAQRLEAVGRMAGGVARDFDRLIDEMEAPVAVLAGAIAPSHPDREAVEEIASAGRRARPLTAQLRTIAQRPPVEPRIVDVTALVADVLPLLRQLAGKAITLALAAAPGAAPVFIDPTQLEQLLSNLTVNARDAMPEGGTLAISVSPVDAEAAPSPDGLPGPRVRIVVRDTGAGMDEATLAHVFEPFFTTKPAGKGTGLGLPTCYGIVSRAGGRIRVESTPGAGTTVTVDLPRAG